MSDLRDNRLIRPGTCTWCGHDHGDRCRSRIQTGVSSKRAVMTGCPCTRPAPTAPSTPTPKSKEDTSA